MCDSSELPLQTPQTATAKKDHPDPAPHKSPHAQSDPQDFCRGFAPTSTNSHRRFPFHSTTLLSLCNSSCTLGVWLLLSLHRPNLPQSQASWTCKKAGGEPTVGNVAVWNRSRLSYSRGIKAVLELMRASHTSRSSMGESATLKTGLPGQLHPAMR